MLLLVPPLEVDLLYLRLEGVHPLLQSLGVRLLEGDALAKQRQERLQVLHQPQRVGAEGGGVASLERLADYLFEQVLLPVSREHFLRLLQQLLVRLHRLSPLEHVQQLRPLLLLLQSLGLLLQALLQAIALLPQRCYLSLQVLHYVAVLVFVFSLR